ncbi:aminopeptidase N [Novosphingopyxis sp.]|uniref:aminopeptidase N n=1 Tax=Novosphingopyxis sp. TaxID=2709690 RepID=UPI003B592337
MADVQKTFADAPTVIRREDYRPPAWLVPDIVLDFDLGIEDTVVHANLKVERNPAAGGPDDRGKEPLRLKGDGIEPVEVLVDGDRINDWRLEGGDLVLPLPADAHHVSITTALKPSENTQLMGLYASGGMLCTQCEAEGFRRIAFHPDRPDVLSRYTVRMEGDAKAFPVLLSNGDLVEEGETDDGRHYAVWNDPHLKPSYLFALVAGDLVANRDSFTTMNGRTVDLGIWVRAGDLERTGHAMTALKNAMKWDEESYGREYDLDIFNIVAVSDFNMGAMENKGLNIFNTRYILADPDTATDNDYDGIEGVVAHEYFHNWSGNRITCRDWFQLSLKEGFTVLRDQQFSADMGSAPVKRIEDVRILRAAQFPEDGGPLAHPIRPDSYMEISNFYTATVYNKGAEVIRMMLTMIGADRFRRGTDLYFDRHDGEAATCEDFITSIEDGGDVDLTQFRRWYREAGTPHVAATLSHEGKTATLQLSQTKSAGTEAPEPSAMVIPLRIALFDRATGKNVREELVMLEAAEKSVSFEGFAQAPVLSINRGFSAPVILDNRRDPADLAFLSAHDDDPFARFEAMQQLMIDHLVGAVSGDQGDGDSGNEQLIVDSIAAALDEDGIDRAFLAEMVQPPAESFLGEQMLVIDPAAIHDERAKLRQGIAVKLKDRWQAHYGACSVIPFSLEPEARAARRLQSVALSYLAAADEDAAAELAFAQFERADNMTQRLSALATLSHGTSDKREAALDIFYNRYRGDALVLDKWFGLQALSLRGDTLEAVKTLSQHPDFTLKNPNRIRSLYGSFTANQVRFHDESGEGYRMLADLILTLDGQNAQLAARFVPTLGRWRRFEEKRSGLMKAELERIADKEGLSKDTSEQVLKSLGR